MWLNQHVRPVVWSRAEDKVLENCLVSFPDETPDRWWRIAAQLPGKSPQDVLDHYKALLQDVSDIENGLIHPPPYQDEYYPAPVPVPVAFSKTKDQERKKGIPWTEEEHRRFLDGLERFGKGDWRSISRNAVVTRTPTQVASHAQKYFIRLNNNSRVGKRDQNNKNINKKKRGSIHDITTNSFYSSSQ